MQRSLLLLAALSLGVMACDESDPDDPTLTDAQRIVGTWDASSASVQVRSVPVPVRVADLASADDVQAFTFGDDGQFSFRFEPQAGRSLGLDVAGQRVSFPLSRVSIAGTYTLNEQTDQITFSTIEGRTEDDFRLGYSLDGTALDLTANNSSTIVRLFGIADETAGQVAGVVDGGTFTYQKAGA